MNKLGKTLNRFWVAVSVVGLLIPLVGCFDDSSSNATDNTDPSSDASRDKISNNRNIQYGSFTDSRDGHVYKTVKIADQVWMAENLNYDDGESLCYNDSPDNCAKYGRLYTWEQASGYSYGYPGMHPVACPEGWHLPTSADYFNLEFISDDYRTAGTILKSRSGWLNNGNGTDDLGFNALPAGFWDPSTKAEFNPYRGSGSSAWFWTADFDEKSDYKAYWMNLTADSSKINVSTSLVMDKSVGMSVRCIQNDESDLPVEEVSPNSVVRETMTDERDGQTYKTVTVGSQTWMAENLNYRIPQSGGDSSSFCFIDKADSCAKYGRLYTWSAVMDGAKVCPKGWHVPTKLEWNILEKAVGETSNLIYEMGISFGGDKKIYVSKAELEYATPEAVLQTYEFAGMMGVYWTASEYSPDYAYCRTFYFPMGNTGGNIAPKANALSLRCIKD